MYLIVWKNFFISTAIYNYFFLTLLSPHHFYTLKKPTGKWHKMESTGMLTSFWLFFLSYITKNPVYPELLFFLIKQILCMISIRYWWATYILYISILTLSFPCRKCCPSQKSTSGWSVDLGNVYEFEGSLFQSNMIRLCVSN